MMPVNVNVNQVAQYLWFSKFDIIFTARQKSHVPSSYSSSRVSPQDPPSRSRTRLGTSQSQREYSPLIVGKISIMQSVVLWTEDRIFDILSFLLLLFSFCGVLVLLMP